VPVGAVHDFKNKKWYSIEPFINGDRFTKYNGNTGYETNNSSDAALTAVAFSHYTFIKSNKAVLVVDLQGIILFFFILFY